jgi:hypothetical protein
VHARRLSQTHGPLVRELLGRIALVELAPPVLARAVEAFPAPVRTLDALHLASLDFLREQGQDVALASYDARMLAVARRLSITIAAL